MIQQHLMKRMPCTTPLHGRAIVTLLAIPPPMAMPPSLPTCGTASPCAWTM
jgi:hypothetical protein